MKTAIRIWSTGIFLSLMALPQCLGQVSSSSQVIVESSKQSVRVSAGTSLDRSADISHQSVLSKRLLLSQEGSQLASSPGSIASLSAVAPFSLIAHSLERTDPESAFTGERAELIAALGTRYSIDNRTDYLCRRRSLVGGRAWKRLMRAIKARSHPVDIQTLTMAIEEIDRLHADPLVRHRALAAASKLLDCPRGYGAEAELLMIALSASAFEIDTQEVQEAVRGVRRTEQYERAISSAMSASKGGIPYATTAALAVALYTPTPLPMERNLYPVNKRSGRDTPDAGPRLCLALSGGGIRSAAFQIGVLQGLRDHGFLSKVDLISAVSGGGYATSWFIASRLNEAKVYSAIPNLFYSDIYYENPANRRKATPPPISPPPPYSFLDETSVAPRDSRFAHLVSLPEGLFLALAGLPAALIEAPYDSLEVDLPSFLLEHRNYTRLLRRAYSIPDYTLAGLARRLEQVTDLAYPIFSATAYAGNCSEEPSPTLGLAAKLSETSFELAPSQVGSKSSGFSSAAPYLYTVADAAAISGAAIDIPSGLACSARQKAYVRLGARLPGPEKTLRYVTDGGYSDNLALAPLLLRRDCQAIIVADAEFDPHLTFSGYQRLIGALKQQKIATIETPGINIITNETSRSCVEGDSPPCFVTHKAADSAPRRSRHEERGWFTGSIQMIEASEKKKIPLLYLKMTVNEDKLESYPEQVLKAIDWECHRPNCEFPHIPTTRQWLSEVQFRGLRHLGRYLVEQALESGEWSPTDTAPPIEP